jgi:hypothetical protein
MTSVSSDSESLTRRRRFSLVAPAMFFILGMLAAGGTVLLPQERAVVIKGHAQQVLKPGQHVMAIVGSFLQRILRQVQDFFDVGALPDDDRPPVAVHDPFVVAEGRP